MEEPVLFNSSKPRIGIDLDGVIALENRPEYHTVRNISIAYKDPTILQDYMRNLKPNDEMVNMMAALRDKYQWRIYTARRKHCLDINSITYEWLRQHKIMPLVSSVTFTPSYKGFHVLNDGCVAMIDNNLVELARIPFIKRYAYQPYDTKEWCNSVFTSPLDCHLIKYIEELYAHLLLQHTREVFK